MSAPNSTAVHQVIWDTSVWTNAAILTTVLLACLKAVILLACVRDVTQLIESCGTEKLWMNARSGERLGLLIHNLQTSIRSLVTKEQTHHCCRWNKSLLWYLLVYMNQTSSCSFCPLKNAFCERTAQTELQNPCQRSEKLLGRNIVLVSFHLVLCKPPSNYARYPLLFRSYEYFIFLSEWKSSLQLKLSLDVQYVQRIPTGFSVQWQNKSRASILKGSSGERPSSTIYRNFTQTLTRPTVPGS